MLYSTHFLTGCLSGRNDYKKEPDGSISGNSFHIAVLQEAVHTRHSQQVITLQFTSDGPTFLVPEVWTVMGAHLQPATIG